MPRPREILNRYGAALLALVLSSILHAALILGTPGSYEAPGGTEEVVFAASLAPGATLVDPVGTQPGPAPAPKRTASAPRKARIARPPIAIAEPLPELPREAPATLPETSPLPAVAEEEAKPGVVALAKPSAAPVAEEARPFPREALPERLRVVYQLSSSFADGRAVYEWKRDGDHYEITGEAEAVGFFALFLEGRVLQSARGTVSPEGLRPERFRERRPTATIEEGLDFDWAAGRVTFDRGPDNRRTQPLEDKTVDWLSMIFQLAHVPPSGNSLDLRVFTQRRIYQFHLKVLGEETIDIPLGKVRALHLRHENPAENEYVDVWLGTDQHYLPVKMRYPVARNRVIVDQVATRISGSDTE